jgi:hypothetical protein
VLFGWEINLRFNGIYIVESLEGPKLGRPLLIKVAYPGI